MATSVPPVQPGPGSNAQVIVMPNTGSSAPVKSNIEQASDAARAALAEGKPLVPAEPAAPHRAAEQPRVAAGHPAGGQFAHDARREVPGGSPTEPERREPIAPEPSPEERRNQPDEQQQVPDPNAPPPAERGEAPPADMAVVIPGATPDDEELAIEFEDPAVAARVREIVSQASQLDQRETQILTDFDEIDRVREAVTADPIGFAMGLLQNGTEGAEQVDHFVLATLTQPEVWARLAPKLQKMVTDANELRVVASEQKGLRADMRERAQSAIAERRAVRENLGQIQQAIAAVIPEDLEPERANVLFHDMLRDIQGYAERYDLLTVPVHELPTLLARRLTALGVDLGEASQRMQRAAQRRAPRGRSPMATRTGSPSTSAGQPAGKPNGTTGTKGTTGTNGKQPTGSEFRTSDQRRRTVAAIPGSGSGSPTTTTSDLTPPRDEHGQPMGIQKTLEWHRARIAKGQRAY